VFLDDTGTVIANAQCNATVAQGLGLTAENVQTAGETFLQDLTTQVTDTLDCADAGSAGGYFKTGAAVNLWDGSPELTSGNSEYFCGEGEEQKVDAISQASGTDPAIANAPINKYYCTLMNALGVKGGARRLPPRGWGRGSLPLRHVRPHGRLHRRRHQAADDSRSG